MNLSHIEHIGIAVNSIEEARTYFEGVLGLKCYAIEEVADQKVKTAFFMIGQTKIELLEATSSESPVAKFIEKRGQGIHHLAFAVENTDEALKIAADKGITLIDNQARKGAEGLNIGFLHPKSTFGILTEFCSKNQ
jgi:methylmalonyl-CoA/ethylmalonyl-CoA epimerase